MSQHNYYEGGCRQQYMRTNPQGRYYLHPNPGAKASIYEKNKESFAKEQRSMRTFALALWEHWFKRVPIFSSFIKKDKAGLYYDHPLGVPATHFLLGIIRMYSSIMKEIKKPVGEWGIDELVRAMRIGQAQTTEVTKSADENRSTLARFCVVISDVCRAKSGGGKSRQYPVTTDSIIPVAGAAILIPPEIHPKLDHHDFEFLRRHKVKTSCLLVGDPVWEELVDSRYRFLQTNKTTYHIRNGQFVLPEEVKAIDKQKAAEAKKAAAEAKKKAAAAAKKKKEADKRKAELAKKKAAAKKKEAAAEKKAAKKEGEPTTVLHSVKPKKKGAAAATAKKTTKKSATPKKKKV